MDPIRGAGQSDADPELADKKTDLAAALEARIADIARLEAELTRMTAEIAALHQQLDQGQQGALRADQADLVIGELSRQLDLRDQTLAEVVADRDRMTAMIEDILGTTSWKATAPLRKLKGMLRPSSRS